MTSHDCNSRPWGTWAQIQEFHDSGHPHSELKTSLGDVRLCLTRNIIQGPSLEGLCLAC